MITMSNIEEMLEYNRSFVSDKQYEEFATTKYPDKKILIIACMDTRLTELLPAAMNFKNGDIKIIKNAGALITSPFGSVMRSVLVAIYELGVEEIYVVGHYDCGVQGLSPASLIQKMLDKGISQEAIDMVEYCGVDVEDWLKGFDSVEDSVMDTMDSIRSHPFMPEGIGVHGFIIDPETGRLDQVAEAALE